MLHPAVSRVFHSPGFSESRFFRVQVFLSPSFSVSRFFRIQFFLGPGFSGSRFFRVRVEGLGPGFRSSPYEKVLWKYAANLQENTHAKVQFQQSYNFIEIALRHGCSPVNLLHIFRTPFLKNTSGWLLLHWSN